MTTQPDTIELKQRLSCSLGSEDPAVRHTIVLYMVYHTIRANSRLKVNSVKALLSTEYLLNETVIDAAIAGLISRSMFECVKRWKSHGRPVGDMSLLVTEPPPDEFVMWLERTELNHPELKMFQPPIYVFKKAVEV